MRAEEGGREGRGRRSESHLVLVGREMYSGNSKNEIGLEGKFFPERQAHPRWRYCAWVGWMEEEWKENTRWSVSVSKKGGLAPVWLRGADTIQG